MNLLIIFRLLSLFIIIQSTTACFGQLVQISESFDQNPGWKGFQNRILPENPPTIRQNFGWVSPDKDAGKPGMIGGILHRSRTVALYAMPLGRPFTFNDNLSAEGTVVLMPREKQGGGYIGFFNHERQEWRPWNSIVWRIGDYPLDGEVHVDYMAANWMANGLRVPELLPGDGKPHKWKLNYNPDATIVLSNEVKALDSLILPGANPESEIFQRLQAEDPTLISEKLHQLLWQGHQEGFLGFKNMGKEFHWWKNSALDNYKGRISFQIDNGHEYVLFLPQEHRNSPASFDRFGIFNFQLYGRHWEFYDNESTGVESEFYIGDLVVNGETIELGTDPHWEGDGNRVTFTDPDFHGRHDYGYSETQWAGGKSPGEVGGTIWRNEVIDPLHSYYADPVGQLTLEDPIRFSGKLAFINGATDGDAIIGYFNEKQRHQVFSGGNRIYPPDLAQQLGARNRIHLGFDQRGSRIPGSMGFTIGGPTTVGFYFAVFCYPTSDTSSMVNGPVIMPDGKIHMFSFNYDPKGGDAGRIQASLDDSKFSLDLTHQQRQAGATFDLFGLTMPRQGGKWATVYIDDIEYTVKQQRDLTHFPQDTTWVKYPPGGRFY